MNGLYYLAEANLYLGIFYLVYCLFLNRNTYYQLSRAYLLFSCIIAFILPLVQLNILKPASPAAQPLQITSFAPVTPLKHAGTARLNLIAALAAAKAIAPSPAPVLQSAHKATKRPFTWQDGLLYGYLIGAGALLFVLLIKLYTLFRLMRREPVVNEDKYRVIYLDGSDVAFSFFNYLFIGADAHGAKTIIRHELVHIQQRHSADIILLELLKIINWFNPFLYMVQNSLKTVHEYIADEQTAAYETDALTYASFLVTNAYGAGGSSITHSFFNYNLLKKRIMMLNQQRSGKLARLKYLVIIPICGALLCTSTLVFSKSYGWLNIGAANGKLAGNHTSKIKRLKVTQNGVTTVTDKLALNQQNEKITYTPATITKADSLALLKNNNIKVEVVEDSIPYKTRDGRPILPVIGVDGYYLMDHFLHHNIKYDATKGEKGGLVVVRFTLDANRHLYNPRIVKSGGAKLDALALNGFSAYRGIVNDDPGKSLKIGVYFFTNDYSIFETDSLSNDPEFAGELIITNYKYPIKVTNKGYEYDENGPGFSATGAKAIIYDQNGEGTWYYSDKCTPADLAMLKDKYGYTFPSAETMIIQINKLRTRLGYIFNVASYLDAPYTTQFYNYILENTEYPKEAQKALEGGVVVLNFNLDNNGMMNNISVAKSAGKGFDEAAVSALRSYKFAIKDIPGEHSIALLFCVGENEYRPAVSDDVKKEGYVGELAVCDLKSPFKDGSIYIPPAPAPKSDQH
ncbi:MAG: TonB family protein [Bacteroidota bacterium]